MEVELPLEGRSHSAYVWKKDLSTCRFDMSGVALALVGSALFLGSQWFGRTFPFAYLGLACSGMGLVFGAGSVIRHIASGRDERCAENGSHRKCGRRAIVGLALVVALGIGTALAVRPMMNLNFQVYLPQRKAAVKWALAASKLRASSVSSEVLPVRWRSLSDGGTVDLVGGGVVFYEFSGALGGSGWLYTQYPAIARDALTDPVQVAPDWWEGGL